MAGVMMLCGVFTGCSQAGQSVPGPDDRLLWREAAAVYKTRQWGFQGGSSHVRSKFSKRGSPRRMSCICGKRCELFSEGRINPYFTCEADWCGKPLWNSSYSM
eukprot:977287-Pyramimonas_sp.AAC.3